MSAAHALQIPASARLQYRLLDANDSELLFELDQDEAVMRFINGGRKTSRAEIAQRLLPRMLSYRDPLKGYGLWQVCSKADNQQLPAAYLGWILVRPMGFFSDQPSSDNLELGWRFKQHAWGQGFATEAAHAVMAALAQQGTVRYFSALADPDNSGSIAVMKKLGMQFIRQQQVQDPLGAHLAVIYQTAVCKQPLQHDNFSSLDTTT